METRESAGAPPRQQEFERLFRGDYQIDVFDCVRQAWELFRKEPGKYIGFTLLLGLISVVINVINQIVLSPDMAAPDFGKLIVAVAFIMLVSLLVGILTIPLNAGYFIAGVKQLSGKELTFGDFFAGYRQAGPIIRNGLAVGGIILLAVLVFGMLAGVAAAFLPASAMDILPVVLSVPIWVMMLILSALFSFSQPLVIDRRMSVLQALETSWKVVIRHWFSIFWLMLVILCVAMLGVFALFVGVLVSAPVSSIMWAVAYKEIFGISRNDW